jgi:lysozyme family protein
MNRFSLAVSSMLVFLLSLDPIYASDLGGSVGDGGANAQSDVLLVQKMLNGVPKPSGGPVVKLDEDGHIGTKTIAAVKRFQKIQLGFEDGKIDVDGRTDKRLAEFNNFVNQPRPGDAIAWGKQVTGDFKTKAIEVAAAVEVDVNHLMAAMAFESGESFSPAIKNAAGSGATGLIQFMPSTATGLGTTTADLAKMTAVQQLDYVEKYFKPYKGKCTTLSDVYMAILLPSAIGKPDTHVLFDKETKPVAYEQNKGLDTDSDGKITKLEASSLVLDKLDKGLKDTNKG